MKFKNKVLFLTFASLRGEITGRLPTETQTETETQSEHGEARRDNWTKNQCNQQFSISKRS